MHWYATCAANAAMQLNKHCAGSVGRGVNIRLV